MAFHDDFRAGKPLFGPFFRTPSLPMAEVFGTLGFDCVCVDQEHAPLDQAQLDLLLMAFRASATPVIVRPPVGSPEQILNALDCGATGIMAPHINTGEAAHAFHHAATFNTADTPGGRGFAGPVRASGYGARSMSDHIRLANQERLTIGQVEDVEALENIDDIVSAPLDCIFIGRSDLTVSMGLTDRKAPEVIEAVEMVARKAIEAGRIVGTFTADFDELPKWREQGISFFLLGSEFGMLKAGATAFKTEVEAKL